MTGGVSVPEKRDYRQLGIEISHMTIGRLIERNPVVLHRPPEPTGLLITNRALVAVIPRLAGVKNNAVPMAF
jgi:hypothetical protein